MNDSHERRGFALYVGVSDAKARENDVDLDQIVGALQLELSVRAPRAESHALTVIAPPDAGPRDLQVVMEALGGQAPEPPPRDPAREICVQIDLARHRVLVDDEDAHLTFTEFGLLQVLVQNEGRTLTRNQLRHAVTDDTAGAGDRAIDVHIRRMRIKFGAYPHLIRTVHGKGYRFDGRHDVSVLRSATPSPDLI
ncbi:MAG: winged helix-turn-helix domain-containing protein [Actinomycetota bacterium]